ncbi:MAG TPA: hypothetical protein VK745_18210, partial [Polyangiaceae bacterium]|nr:hypothetical protein [Polyangiaceae bacterium]
AGGVLGGVWLMVHERAEAPLTRHATATDNAPQTERAEQSATAPAPVALVASSASLASAQPSQPTPTPSPPLATTRVDARAAPRFAAAPASRRQQLLSLATERERAAPLPFQAPLVAQARLVATAAPVVAVPPAPAPPNAPVENPLGARK